MCEASDVSGVGEYKEACRGSPRNNDSNSSAVESCGSVDRAPNRRSVGREYSRHNHSAVDRAPASVAEGSRLVYDLHSVVCHRGSANAGHYTCFARHPQSGVWHHYNDETVSQQAPDRPEYSSGYVLFYQKQGTEEEFSPPTCNLTEDEETTATTASTTSQANSSSSNNNKLSLALPLCEWMPPSPSSTTVTHTTSNNNTDAITTTISSNDTDGCADEKSGAGNCEDYDCGLPIHFETSFPTD